MWAPSGWLDVCAVVELHRVADIRAEAEGGRDHAHCQVSAVSDVTRSTGDLSLVGARRRSNLGQILRELTGPGLPRRCAPCNAQNHVVGDKKEILRGDQREDAPMDWGSSGQISSSAVPTKPSIVWAMGFLLRGVPSARHVAERRRGGHVGSAGVRAGRHCEFHTGRQWPTRSGMKALNALDKDPPCDFGPDDWGRSRGSVLVLTKQPEHRDRCRSAAVSIASVGNRLAEMQLGILLRRSRSAASVRQAKEVCRDDAVRRSET